MRKTHVIQVKRVISEPMKKGWNYAHIYHIDTCEETLRQCCRRSKPCYECGDGKYGVPKNNYADAPVSRWKRHAPVMPEAFQTAKEK